MNWYNSKIRSEEVKTAQLHYCDWLNSMKSLASKKAYMAFMKNPLKVGGQ